MITTTTIDLAALADYLKALGWEKRSLSLFHYGGRRISLDERRTLCWHYYATMKSDIPIDLTDPIWLAALPILLRHVAGEKHG